MQIKVWDIWVRLFHWSLVITVCTLLVSGETGLGFFDWHKLAGETVFGLLLFRLAWGFFGSSNARLIDLIAKPSRVVHHLRALLSRKPKQERGHNAAGGWAVLVMFLLLTVQSVTGMFIADEEGWVEGAFHGVVSQDLTDLLHQVHHINADILKLLVIFHVVMVFLYLLYAKQNLIRPMITGGMFWNSSEAPPEVRFGRVSIGLVLLVLCTSVIVFLIR